MLAYLLCFPNQFNMQVAVTYYSWSISTQQIPGAWQCPIYTRCHLNIFLFENHVHSRYISSAIINTETVWRMLQATWYREYRENIYFELYNIYLYLVYHELSLQVKTVIHTIDDYVIFRINIFRAMCIIACINILYKCPCLTHSFLRSRIIVEAGCFTDDPYVLLVNDHQHDDWRYPIIIQLVWQYGNMISLVLWKILYLFVSQSIGRI